MRAWNESRLRVSGIRGGVTKSTPAPRIALKSIKAIGGTDVDAAITHNRIALACFDAAHYKPELDPGQVYRKEIQAEKKKLDQLAMAAHVLALSAGRNEKGLMWACQIAESTSGVRITRIEKPGRMPHHLVVEKYFLQLETALRGKLPELHGGPWLHRFTIGNLSYDRAISTGRPLTTETMLGFELAFYLRMHTAGRAKDSLQNGQGMPDDGNPCYPVVAAFCSAVLGTSHDAKQIGDKVRDLKSVGLTEWPKGGY